jgi:hypothetical protein
MAPNMRETSCVRTSAGERYGCAPWIAMIWCVCGAPEIRWIVSTHVRSTWRRWLAPPACLPAVSHGHRRAYVFVGEHGTRV